MTSSWVLSPQGRPEEGGLFLLFHCKALIQSEQYLMWWLSCKMFVRGSRRSCCVIGLSLCVHFKLRSVSAPRTETQWRNSRYHLQTVACFLCLFLLVSFPLTLSFFCHFLFKLRRGQRKRRRISQLNKTFPLKERRRVSGGLTNETSLIWNYLQSIEVWDTAEVLYPLSCSLLLFFLECSDIFPAWGV